MINHNTYRQMMENEFSKINLNVIRRAGAHDDGVFNECKLSDY